MARTRLGRRKEHICVVAVLLCAAPFANQWAEARSCGPTLPIERDFGLSSAVFVGTIVATEVQQGVELNGAQTIATFSVERAWKGVSGPTIRVASPGGGNVFFSTSLSFKPGERYVIFASGAFPSSIQCGRTATETHYLWNETMEWLLRRPAEPFAITATIPRIRKTGRRSSKLLRIAVASLFSKAVLGRAVIRAKRLQHS